MINVQCITCNHYQGDLKCKAFPDGIPKVLWTGHTSHEKPYEGDNGIQYEDNPQFLLKKEE